MPNSGGRQQSSGSSGKSIASFGFGALVGALAAGAAWYLSSEEEQRPHQHQRYPPNHPSYQAPSPPPRSASTNSTDKEDDEKDGTVKVCEICFASFAELKECGVQIVTTPCGHLYCRECILGALSVKPECPHCRSEVREQNLTRLYM